MQLVERLAERAAVAQVAPRHDDPVWDLPVEALQDTQHDRLLALQAERVDAVDQVDAQLARDLAYAEHRVVEIAGDLHRQRAIVERLRELPVADLTRTDKDHGLHQPAHAAVQGERRAGVAGRSAGSAFGADHPRVGEGGRHAVVLEAARGVHPLVLQHQPGGVHADIVGHAGRGVQRRLPLADGDDLVVGSEWEQLTEAPHAGPLKRLVAARPLLLKVRQAGGNRQAVPVVSNVQERAAGVARGPHFADVVRGAAAGHHALLIGDVGAGGGGGHGGGSLAGDAARRSRRPFGGEQRAQDD